MAAIKDLEFIKKDVEYFEVAHLKKMAISLLFEKVGF